MMEHAEIISCCLVTADNHMFQATEGLESHTWEAKMIDWLVVNVVWVLWLLLGPVAVS